MTFFINQHCSDLEDDLTTHDLATRADLHDISIDLICDIIGEVHFGIR